MMAHLVYEILGLPFPEEQQRETTSSHNKNSRRHHRSNIIHQLTAAPLMALKELVCVLHLIPNFKSHCDCGHFERMVPPTDFDLNLIERLMAVHAEREETLKEILKEKAAEEDVEALFGRMGMKEENIQGALDEHGRILREEAIEKGRTHRFKEQKEKNVGKVYEEGTKFRMELDSDLELLDLLSDQCVYGGGSRMGNKEEKEEKDDVVEENKENAVDLLSLRRPTKGEVDDESLKDSSVEASSSFQGDAVEAKGAVETEGPVSGDDEKEAESEQIIKKKKVKHFAQKEEEKELDWQGRRGEELLLEHERLKRAFGEGLGRDLESMQDETEEVQRELVGTKDFHPFCRVCHRPIAFPCACTRTTSSSFDGGEEVNPSSSSSSLSSSSVPKDFTLASHFAHLERNRRAKARQNMNRQPNKLGWQQQSNMAATATTKVGYH